MFNGYNYQKSVELSLSAQLAPSARARPDLLDDLNIGSHWFTSSKFPEIIPELKVELRQGRTEPLSWGAEAGHCKL